MAAYMHDNGNDVLLPAGTPVVDVITPVAVVNAKKIHQQILDSQDKLFFISYRGANTIRPRWYLCAINTSDSDMSDAGQYHVDFFRKHPKDEKKKDNMSRFGPDWYQIKWANKEKS